MLLAAVNEYSGNVYSYTYDNLGQLVREDNQVFGKTYIYTYDNAGNITSKSEYAYTLSASPMGNATVHTYSYEESYTDEYSIYYEAWGDKLISYDGVAITYDGIGNPLSYYNGTSYNFTWEGRRLKTATFGGGTYTFGYDDEGRRVKKTVGNETVEYFYEGDRLLLEKSDSYAIA